MGNAYLVQPGGGGGKSIKRAVIMLSFTDRVYDGSQRVPEVMNVMLGDKQLVKGKDYVVYAPPATDVGTYNIIVSGMGEYAGAAQTSWTISKAQGKISVEPQSVEIVGAIGSSTMVTLDYTGDGEITFGESEYVTCSREGNTVTVTSKAEGSGSVTITLEDGRNYKGASTTLDVKVTLGSKILEENSWELIASIAASGKASEFWSVGDIKKVTLTGEDASTYGLQIIGFDQDVLAPTDAKYSDSSYNGGKKKAAITFQFVELLKTYRKMHTSNDNSCSWEKSDMRVTTMPLVLSEMPSDVKYVMRTVTKKAPQSTSNKNLISTADKLFLLGPHEVFKSPSYADFTAEGELYTYYASGNSTVKNQLGGSALHWWLRCPATDGSTYFCYVDINGSSNSATVTATSGVAAGFCV